jgi:hypothetical protein
MSVHEIRPTTPADDELLRRLARLMDERDLVPENVLEEAWSALGTDGGRHVGRRARRPAQRPLHSV